MIYKKIFYSISIIILIFLGLSSCAANYKTYYAASIDFNQSNLEKSKLIVKSFSSSSKSTIIDASEDLSNKNGINIIYYRLNNNKNEIVLLEGNESESTINLFVVGVKPPKYLDSIILQFSSLSGHTKLSSKINR
jgi:hypothetical protein